MPNHESTTSKAARRAAGALNEAGLLRDCWAIPDAREIIERETGAGEAVALLTRLMEHADWRFRIQGSFGTWKPLVEETKSFLQRFNQD